MRNEEYFVAMYELVGAVWLLWEASTDGRCDIAVSDCLC